MTLQRDVPSPLPAPGSPPTAERNTMNRIGSVAIAVGCSLCGVTTTEMMVALDGSFVPAILILPVFVATWYGGVLSGGLTVALQTVTTAAFREPAFSLRIASPDDLGRLLVVTVLSAAAVWMVSRARTIERYFRTIVEIAMDGIWVVDAAGLTTFVNPRMAEMLGLTRAEMLGRRFTAFVPQEAIAAVETAFEGLRRGGRSGNDAQLLRKDGSALWVYYAAAPILDGATFDGALAVVTDISQRKSDESVIRSQADELRQRDVQKDQFLAMLSHELRNPLGAIMTALKLIDLKGETSYQRERMIIGRQAARLSRLVDDLSDVSRFMRGKVAMVRETVDMAEVIERARETVAPLLSRKGHSLELDLPAEMIVEGDAARLEQVIVNLLANAAKYTPSGGRILIRGECDPESVTIGVRDNGLGISPEFLPVVFEPFAQRPEVRALSEGGLGLGLAIVRAIVLGHGGTIEAHSDGEGRGSEFVVRVPVASISASDQSGGQAESWQAADPAHAPADDSVFR